MWLIEAWYKTLSGELRKENICCHRAREGVLLQWLQLLLTIDQNCWHLGKLNSSPTLRVFYSRGFLHIKFLDIALKKILLTNKRKRYSVLCYIYKKEIYFFLIIHMTICITKNKFCRYVTFNQSLLT